MQVLNNNPSFKSKSKRRTKKKEKKTKIQENKR